LRPARSWDLAEGPITVKTMTAHLAVAIDDPGQLAGLELQTLEDAELIAFGDAATEPFVAEFARARGWSYKACDSLHQAVRSAEAVFVVDWDAIYDADVDLLKDLVARASEHPELMGATAPNFDGVIVWRLTALDGSKQFPRGLAHGTVYGFAGLGRLAPGMLERPEAGEEANS